MPSGKKITKNPLGEEFGKKQRVSVVTSKKVSFSYRPTWVWQEALRLKKKGEIANVRATRSF